MVLKYYRATGNSNRERDKTLNDRINILRPTWIETIMSGDCDFAFIKQPPKTVPQFGPTSQNIKAQYHQAFNSVQQIKYSGCVAQNNLGLPAPDRVATKPEQTIAST